MKRFRVVVLDVGSGRTIAELSSDGKDGMALSPDGRYLALAVRKLGGSSRLERYDLSVDVYDLQSTTVIQSLPHDRVWIWGTRVSSYFVPNGLEFTSDGRFLFVSGRNTKTWKLST